MKPTHFHFRPRRRKHAVIAGTKTLTFKNELPRTENHLVKNYVKLCLIVAVMLFLGIVVSSADDVTLLTSDAAGTSSFTGSTNWDNGLAPTNGNDYFTGQATIRTTNDTI